MIIKSLDYDNVLMSTHKYDISIARRFATRLLALGQRKEPGVTQPSRTMPDTALVFFGFSQLIILSHGFLFIIRPH